MTMCKYLIAGVGGMQGVIVYPPAVELEGVA